MKFQVKTLIAALALTASGVASAAYQAPATGNGSLVLSVFDRTSNTAVWFDTGLTYSSLNEIGSDVAHSGFDASNSALTFDLSTNAAFLSFVGSATLSTTYYNVFAGDSLGGGTVAGARGLISSYDNVNYADAQNFTISKGPLLTAVAGNNFDVVQNNDPFTYFSADNNANQGAVSIALLGSQMSLYQTVQKSSNGAGDNFFYNNTKVNFTNGGLLTISSVQPTTAVPEPESYALMMLGMGVVAAAARRRKSAK